MNEKNILLDSIAIFGEANQLDQSIEEAAELIQAINKYKRKKFNARNGILEELTDVEIMITKIKFILAYEEKELEEMKLYKLQKLKNETESYKRNSKKI